MKKWLIIIVVLLGAGWYLYDNPALISRITDEAPRALKPSAKKAYRWKDAAGVTHFSDEPPNDRAYEEVTAEPKKQGSSP